MRGAGGWDRTRVLSDSPRGGLDVARSCGGERRPQDGLDTVDQTDFCPGAALTAPCSSLGCSHTPVPTRTSNVTPLCRALPDSLIPPSSCLTRPEMSVAPSARTLLTSFCSLCPSPPPSVLRLSAVLLGFSTVAHVNRAQSTPVSVISSDSCHNAARSSGHFVTRL